MINTVKHRAAEEAYRKQAQLKTQIVLHYTAGYNANGCAASFRKSGAGTAYILDVDGTIYEWFSPEFWDSHLFRHKAGESPLLYALEKCTIGIEIANLGPLHLGKGVSDKNVLYTYTNKKYCTLDDKEKYVQSEYKKQYFWASYTEGQYAALRTLLPMLSERFGINLLADPLGPRLDFWPLEKMIHYNGVTTHVNYRRDKYDVGPAFDWSRVGLA